MKITKVEIMATNTPFLGTEGNTGEIAQGKWELCRFVVVKVHTDEGIVGYGESAPFARLSPLGQKPIIDVLVDYYLHYAGGQRQAKVLVRRPSFRRARDTGSIARQNR